MKKIFIFIIAFYCLLRLPAQTMPNNSTIIYGAFQKAELAKPPFETWFVQGYESYQPDKEILGRLKGLLSNDISIRVFLGTWCGDSKREVPRLLKLLDQVSFPHDQLQLIGLGGSDSLFKQSPGSEESGLGIFRVPTIIVYRKGVEVNRINEYPVGSLEEDLLAILNRQPYVPNYKTFSFIYGWMKEGRLLNKNISARSLASRLRYLPEGEAELNSLGHLLLRQGRKEDALRIFQINFQLYPESARASAGLGEGYAKNGDAKNALIYLEKALELNRDPARVREILSLVYDAKRDE